MLDNEYLNLLRGIAFYIKIEEKKNIDGAITIDSLIEILEGIKRSYYGYIEVQFLKTYGIKTKYNLEKKIDVLKKEFDLVVVDCSFSSFNAGLAPNYISQNLIDEQSIIPWKKNTFKEFKEDLFFCDYNSNQYSEYIIKKFNDEERRKIFTPLLSVIKKNNVKVFASNNLIEKPKQIKITNKDIIKKIIPDKIEIIEEKEILVKTYLKIIVKSNSEKIDIRRDKIKEIFEVEELPFDTYPYVIDRISNSGKEILFNETISCDVIKEENNISIFYSHLHFSAHGKTREEAIENFNRTFYETYNRLAISSDAELSQDERIQRINLFKLIKVVNL